MHGEKTLYLRLGAEDCASNVVLVGDPGRLSLFADELCNASITASEREFNTLTGTFSDMPVSVVSVGIGAPSAAIVLEELWELGARVVVRAGTAMALDVPLGSFVLPFGAARYEGVSTTYLPLEFPAVSDPELFLTMRQVLDDASMVYSTGVIASSDGFYTHLFRRNAPRHALKREDSTLLDYFGENRVVAMDMETSAVYSIGYYLGLKCVSLLLVTVNGRTKETIEASSRPRSERMLARLVLKGLQAYEQRRAVPGMA